MWCEVNRPEFLSSGAIENKDFLCTEGRKANVLGCRHALLNVYLTRYGQDDGCKLAKAKKFYLPNFW